MGIYRIMTEAKADYVAMKIIELKALASEKGYKNLSKLNKPQLIHLMQTGEMPAAKPKEPKPRADKGTGLPKKKVPPKIGEEKTEMVDSAEAEADDASEINPGQVITTTAQELIEILGRCKMSEKNLALVLSELL